MYEYNKNFDLKPLMGRLFGNQAWLELKESGCPWAWRKYMLKTLNAIRLSIDESVTVYDDDWKIDIHSALDRGIALVESKRDVSEIISAVTVTLMELCFLQIGFSIPNNENGCFSSMRKGNMDLSSVRTVMYIQNNEQKDKLSNAKKKREASK